MVETVLSSHRVRVKLLNSMVSSKVSHYSLVIQCPSISWHCYWTLDIGAGVLLDKFLVKPSSELH